MASSSSDDDYEHALELEKRIAQDWGKSKKEYYQNTEKITEDLEEAELEEEEIRLMQHDRSAKRDDTDYTLGQSDEEEEDDRGSEAVIQEEKRPTEMTLEERQEYVAEHMPEVFQIIAELKTKLATVKEKAETFVKERESLSEVEEKNGISFLKVRYQLLLSYCKNLAFFLLLKASGKPVQSHPVVDRLCSLRVFLEKTDPIEKKLRYKVDKLLKSEFVQDAARDPSSFKPQPELMTSHASSDSQKKTKVSEEGEALYVPPKNLMVDIDAVDSTEKKKEKRQRKLQEKAKKSLIYESIRDEFHDAPAEEQVYGVDDFAEIDSDEEAKRRYEEDNYMRLFPSKQDKQKKASKSQNGERFDDFDDFDDLKDILQAGHESDEKRSDIDEEEGMKLYNQIAKQTEVKKHAKKPTDVFYGEGPQPVDGARRASKTILQNRGIKRYRKKEDKNPRKRMRNKFEKQQIKKKSVIQQYKGAQQNYGGEKTGFRDDVTKSTRL